MRTLVCRLQPRKLPATPSSKPEAKPAAKKRRRRRCVQEGVAAETTGIESEQANSMKLTVYGRWRFGWYDAGEGLRITFVYDAAQTHSRLNVTQKVEEEFRHDAFTLTPKGILHARFGLLERIMLLTGDDITLLPVWRDETALIREFFAFCGTLDEAIRWSWRAEEAERRRNVMRAEARLHRRFAFAFAPAIGITFHYLDEHLSIQLDADHTAQLNVTACERVRDVVDCSVPAQQLCCVHPASASIDCFCYACVVRLMLGSYRARVWLFACLTLFLNWRDFARAHITAEQKAAYDAVYSIEGLFNE